MITDEHICNCGILKVKVKNINEVPEEEYALLRKESFGGSDASILCGVNLYKNMDQLIIEKNSKFLTEEEKEVGKKAIVRKGRDLEPIILDKASKELGIEITKPTSMYEFLETPILTLNYDGVCEKDNILIPIEAKLVSKWGEKYYNKEAFSAGVNGQINSPLRYLIKSKEAQESTYNVNSDYTQFITLENWKKTGAGEPE